MGQLRTLLFLVALLPCVFSQVSWRTFRDQCLVGGNRISLDSVTLTECQTACLEERTMLCVAVEYNEVLVQCSLISENSMTIKVVNPCSTSGVNLYEYGRAENWATHTGTCLATTPAVIYQATLEVICRELCETEINFRCSAFNYDYINYECELTREDSSTRTLLTPCPYGEVDTHVRSTDSNWKEYYNSILTSGTSGARYIESINIEECLRTCEDETSFECKGVQYEFTRVPVRCGILRNNNQTHAIDANSARHYFERVIVSKWRHQSDACVVESARGNGIADVSENGCMRACERAYSYDFTVSCQSISYDAANQMCYLHAGSSVNSGHPVGSPCPQSNFKYAEKIDDCA